MNLVRKVVRVPRAFVAITVAVIAWATISPGAACAADDKPAAKQPPAAKDSAAPAHRVIACYFHRTVRCDTCKRISAYIEEAVKEKLAAELKDGRVEVLMVNFQDPQNKVHTDRYKITGPTLVIMDVRDGLVRAWKPAPRVWALVADKTAFFQYVASEVRSYLDAKGKP